MVDKGREPPPQYFEQPDVPLHLHGIWDAFFELTTERQIGMAAGPIPASIIKRYGAGEYGLEGDELDRFYRIIGRMDGEYLGYKPAAKPDPRERATAKIDDPRAMKEMLLDMQARKKAEMARKRKPQGRNNADA
jgi:hypothetical protein